MHAPGAISVSPVDDTTLVVLANDELDRSGAYSVAVRLASGIRVAEVTPHASDPRGLLVTLELDTLPPVAPDRAWVTGLRTAAGEDLGEVMSGDFIVGAREPMELKAGHVEPAFPFGSRLVGTHVIVTCCGGCNGGMHPRGLQVLNNHIGGPWTSMWVQTTQPIKLPYRRWQKVRMAGGVLEERNGSTVVVDRGHMKITVLDEPAHHAPPALRITTADLPSSESRELIHKALDGCFVEFRDITITSARNVNPPEPTDGTIALDYVELVFSDDSGGQTVAWLYQREPNVSSGDRLTELRGFIHAEAPGVYVVISDKDEDLVRS